MKRAASGVRGMSLDEAFQWGADVVIAVAGGSKAPALLRAALYIAQDIQIAGLVAIVVFPRSFNCANPFWLFHSRTDGHVGHSVTGHDSELQRSASVKK